MALALAERRIADGDAVELVSVDSMAVYRGMDIGTTTPAAAERARVPHHLVDLVDPADDFSLVEFRDAAIEALAGVEERGARAVLVGGTGLYVTALIDGLVPPGRYPDVAAELAGESDTELLHLRLEVLDPLAASRIEAGNRRRVLRALEVTLGSGRPFSSFGPGLDTFPPTPFVLAGLRVERDQLRPRIERRLRAQLDAGFLDEVRALDERPTPVSRTAAQALGYAELRAHLHGEGTLDDAVAAIVDRTRRLAVRQERWFRRDPRIIWFDPTEGLEVTVARIDRLWRAAEDPEPGAGGLDASDGEERRAGGGATGH